MKPDGGPAFPVGDQSLHPLLIGMSLRDYFAAAIASQIIAEYFKANGACFGADHFFRNVPTHIFQIADAMLAERDK
jgi:hypothetical protein